MAEPKIKCACGHDKVHTQVVWFKMEVEIPLAAESSSHWTSDNYQHQIPICRRCLTAMLQQRQNDPTVNPQAAERLILDLTARKKKRTEEFPDEELEQEIVSAAIGLVFEVER